MLDIDFETRSMLELGGKESVGLHRYALSAEPLMIAWAYDDEPVELHEFHKGSMPDKLLKGLKDPGQQLVAYNSAFERYVLQYCFGIVIPASRFHDPQVSARYLSLPSSLDEVGKILNMPKELRKDKRGEGLIDLFSYPHKLKKKKGEPVEWKFNDWNSHPEEWAVFGDYCKQDVRAEREILRRLALLEVYPLIPRERELWLLDQKINDRGVPVDLGFVQKGYRLALRAKQEAIQKQNDLTGLKNANSRTQLLPWAKQRGYTLSTLRKDVVQQALKNPKIILTEECREVLTARLEASSTSYQKLGAILRQISPDNRLRNQFVFLGSARAGRWSSAGGSVQLHNMARPSPEFEDMDNLTVARNMIYQEDYEGIKARFKSVLLTVKNCIRTVFVAPEGHRLTVCDENAIETRVGAWLSGCKSLLDVFQPLPGRKNGLDPYLDFANKMTGIPYDKLDADLHSKDSAVKSEAKQHRQTAKVGVLGAIYRLGGGTWGKSKTAIIDKETGERVRDVVRTGLWGFSHSMGVELTQERSHEVVRVFREAYSEIPACWYALEKAISEVLKGVVTVRHLGPNDSVKIDKLNIADRDPLLRIQLPSGRRLHFVDARMQLTRMPWDDREGNEVLKETLVYSGVNQDTKQWGEITSHGGKTFEQCCQGIARDVLGEKLLQFEASDLNVVLHVHDEGGCETPDDPFSPGIAEAEEIMSSPINWAPGLLLGADGFEEVFYHK